MLEKRTVPRVHLKLHPSLLLFVLLLCFSAVRAQPQLVWTLSYRWHESLWPTSIVSSDDGGFFIVGCGDHDGYLSRIDRLGNYMWAETYGGDQGEIFWSIVHAPDGNLMLVGNTWSFGAGRSDAYVVRVNTKGEMIWQRAYGGTADDYGYVAVDSDDGGFVLAGTTEGPHGRTDIHLLKIDGNGEKLWERIYGGDGWDFAYGMAQTHDGGFIIVGNTTSWYGGQSADVYVLRVDRNGERIWEKAYGGPDADTGLEVVQAGDGGYIVAGYTYSLGLRAYLLKINEGGDKIWETTYRGSSAHSIVRSWDGGYVVAGGIAGAGSRGMYVLRIDEQGAQLWDETYEGGCAVSLCQSSDGGFAILGYSFPREVHIVKIFDPIQSISYLRQRVSNMLKEIDETISTAFEEMNQTISTRLEEVNGSLTAQTAHISNTLKAINQSLTAQTLELDKDRERVLAHLGSIEALTAKAGNLTATILHQVSQEIVFLESFVEREIPALEAVLSDQTQKQTAQLLVSILALEQAVEQQLRLLNATSQAQHEAVTDLIDHLRAEEDGKYRRLRNLAYLSILLWAGAAGAGLFFLARRRPARGV